MNLPHLRKDFQRLLEREIPREEYLLQKTLTNWSLFLADSGLDSHPIYQRFIAEFGLKAARLAFDDHKRICREWWFERDIALRLPALGDVLRRLFDRAFLCRVKWEHLVQAVQNHSEFEAYFIPLGQSVERLSAFDEWVPFCKLFGNVFASSLLNF